jgi:CRP-like cAMP-binding protein
MRQNHIELFRQVGIFREMKDTDLQTAVETCICSEFEKDSEILRESELTSDVFFVLKGSLLAKGYSQDGKALFWSVD